MIAEAKPKLALLARQPLGTKIKIERVAYDLDHTPKIHHDYGSFLLVHMKIDQEHLYRPLDLDNCDQPLTTAQLSNPRLEYKFDAGLGLLQGMPIAGDRNPNDFFAQQERLKQIEDPCLWDDQIARLLVIQPLRVWDFEKNQLLFYNQTLETQIYQFAAALQKNS